MPFMHKHIKRVKTPQLLREYRNTLLQIVSIEYDLKLSMYLQHPGELKEDLADEMQEYINYSSCLQRSEERRVGKEC